MIKRHSDFKKGIVKLKVEDVDDLWTISRIVEEGDEVTSRTYRKIKKGNEDEKSSVQKKHVVLTIEVEEVDYKENVLRLNGVISVPTEDIPKGSYHSLNIEVGSELEIKKEKWLKFQKDRLEESLSGKSSSILILALSRDKAIFAQTTRQGYNILSKLSGEVQKKDERDVVKSDFYGEINKKLNDYYERIKPEHIILASPAFWKEDFLKKVTNQEMKKKIVLATCYSTEENAISEVLKREEVKKVLHEERNSKEIRLVESLLKEISKNGKAVYGFDEVKKAVDMGAVKQLLITDSYIKQSREEGNFSSLESLMHQVEDTKGEVNIIKKIHEGGEKLDSLGGIGGILRYKI